MAESSELSEDDYIAATDLAKVRIIENILSDINSIEDFDRRALFSIISDFRRKLERQISHDTE